MTETSVSVVLRLKDYVPFLAIVACLILKTSANSIVGDECDWTGSGLTSTASTRGVTPVYLRCTAGRVTWLYPRGALRILLRLPAQDREFRACIKLHHDGRKDIAARVFLEGPRSLHPLYASQHVGTKASRCFNSKNGMVALYVEASNPDSVLKRVADIEYDLQTLPKGATGYDPSEECRPCTGEELAHAFCTSDLVARGIIHGVENVDELQVSRVFMKVTKMIRHTTEDGYYRDIETNSIDNEIQDEKEIVLNMPQHCGVNYGLGEFVFMAKRKLGDLTIRCAPRLEDWATLLHRLSEEGTAHCLLKS